MNNRIRVEIFYLVLFYYYGDLKVKIRFCNYVLFFLVMVSGLFFIMLMDMRVKVFFVIFRGGSWVIYVFFFLVVLVVRIWGSLR